VAVDIGPDGGVAVEVAAALGVPEPAALASGDVDPGVVQVLPHLGEGVPGVPPVGGIEVADGRRGLCEGLGHEATMGPGRSIVKPEVILA
jgi:hypothetical protein